ALKTTSKLRGWEGWTNESIELHLQTRFAQLEVAASLELWTEGFRTVEDIYTVMQIGKKTPKARLMASYYEKLSRIFWVSENQLFHAYAWYKYYSLGSEYNKTLTVEAKALQANCVLLAALSIPEIRSESASQLFDEDDLKKQKNQRMATLLGFSTDPSREALLSELVKKGLLAQVSPQVLSLYKVIETNFCPMTIVKDAKPFLTALKDGPKELASYVPSLECVVVLRLLAQLSSIYHTVTLEKLESYLSGVSLSFQEVEKLVVKAVKGRQLKVTMDHQARCLRFGAEVLETDSMRTQLSSLATQLQKAITLVEPPEDRSNPHQRQREAFFSMVMSSMPREHADALTRKNIIEKRKEEAERREQERHREEARVKAEEEAKRKAEEASRLEREARLREKEKLHKVERELELAQTKEMLARLGKKVENVDKMDKSGREELIRKTRDSVLKEKEDEDSRLKQQAKRLDYITRALRMEEMPVLKDKYQKQVDEDRKDHERRWRDHLVRHKKVGGGGGAVTPMFEQGFKGDMEDKKVVAHMQDAAREFQQGIVAMRMVEYGKEVKEAEERAKEIHKQRKVERALRRMRKAEEEAERQKEEEERLEREEEDRARREAAEAEAKALEQEAMARRKEEQARRDEDRAVRGLGPEEDHLDGPGLQSGPRGSGYGADRADQGTWQRAGPGPRGSSDDRFRDGPGASMGMGMGMGPRGEGGAGDMGRPRDLEGGWRRSGGGGPRFEDRGGDGPVGPRSRGGFNDRDRDGGYGGGRDRGFGSSRGGGGFGGRDDGYGGRDGGRDMGRDGGRSRFNDRGGGDRFDGGGPGGYDRGGGMDRSDRDMGGPPRGGGGGFDRPDRRGGDRDGGFDRRDLPPPGEKPKLFSGKGRSLKDL
ncbi:unnamed protein product, partial [Discosporangium mesarthrocarpum]